MCAFTQNAGLLNATMWMTKMLNTWWRKFELCIERGWYNSTWKFCSCFLSVGWVLGTVTDQDCKSCSEGGRISKLEWSVWLEEKELLWPPLFGKLCYTQTSNPGIFSVSLQEMIFCFFINWFPYPQWENITKCFLIIKISTLTLTKMEENIH